jgi:AcrR family transcriptional regulator
MKDDHKSPVRTAAVGDTPRRPPGRPPRSHSSINRTTILRTAHRLSKTIPLQELSIVVVAKEMGVTPALIHYYIIGGRDWLTSGIMNMFYRDLLKRLPEFTGNWARDLRAATRAIFERLIEYGGVASYMASHNRFRTFQLTAFGERDYGVEVLEKLAACVLQAGRAEDRTGIYTFLIMEFIINAAHGKARHHFPSDHRAFLEEKVAKLDAEKFPTLMLTKSAPLSLGAETAFEEGMRLLMLGLELEPLRTQARTGRASKSTKRRDA